MTIRKTFVIFFLLFLFLFVFNKNIIFSISCDQQTISNNHSNEEWNKIIEECSKQDKELGSQLYDADVQLELINTQYNLSQAQFRQTEQKIVNIEREVNILGSRIEGLDKSLTNLSGLLIQKIVESYKQKSTSLFDLIFDSQNASELLVKIKYVKTARDNNQKLLVQVQEAKSNFEEQKKLRDEKKTELDNLKILLAQQQIGLQNKKRQQDEYIITLKASKAETQRILNIARQQIAGFKSFVSNVGAGIISANQFGIGSDGAYYSQRDERWANQTIGYSSENILSVGCLLTSVSMVAKHYGDNITPSNIASDPSRFYGYTAYMSLPWKSVAGRSYYGGVNVDQELQNGNYVIVGVGGCSYGGSHFIVLTKKDGDDYIMNDPIYGPDLKLSAHYSKSFCSTATFK